MTCPDHPDTPQVEDCIFCMIDCHVVAYHGHKDPANRSPLSGGFLYGLSASGLKAKAAILSVISWRLERGEKLYALGPDVLIRACPQCGRTTALPKETFWTCGHCNLARRQETRSREQAT